MYKLRPVDSENTQLLPQRVKSCSVSGFTLLSIMERNRAHSAFKRLFSSTAFAYVLKKLKKGWREKSEREQDNSRILYDYYPHKMEENRLDISQF